MKTIPLRRRYFRDVMGMGWLILLVCMLVLTAFNVVEYVDHRGEGSEELLEMIVLFAALLATFPLVILLAWRTSGRLLRPLKEIQQTVQEIREGDLKRRLKVDDADDELAYMVSSLNEAFDAHQTALGHLQQFSSNVSHQLRTPLTAMITEGQLALSRERSPDEYRDTLGRLLEQTDHLSRVIDQLLLLAKVTSERTVPEFEVVNLPRLTTEVLKEFRPYINDRGSEWSERIGEGKLLIRGNPWWLRESLSNLVNNALLYTPEPAKFTLKIWENENDVCWQLEDSGPGIPSDYQERIFEPFQRGEDVSDRGAGLGLSIVQEVVRLHQGKLYVCESELGGCGFCIEIPKGH